MLGSPFHMCMVYIAIIDLIIKIISLTYINFTLENEAISENSYAANFKFEEFPTCNSD